MKNVLIIAALALCSIAANAQTKKDHAAKKDTINLPAQAQQTPKLYYIVMSGPDWDNLIQMLLESSYPSSDVSKYRKYIVQNIHELVLPKDSTDKKK